MISLRHARPAAGLALALVLASPAVRADDVEDLCIASSLEGQVLQRAGRLEGARARFAACAKPECAAAKTSAPCAAWEAAVAPRIPKLVVVVKDDLGRPLPDAEVLLDGTTLTQRHLALDPGHHVVRASWAGRTARRELDVAAGDALTVELVVDLSRRIPERPVPTWVLVTGGVAALGFASFAVLGESTLGKERDLESCRPYCDPSERSALATRAGAADVALGVGVVAAVVATVGWLVRPTHERVERIVPESASR